MTRLDKGVYAYKGYYVYKSNVNGKWVMRKGSIKRDEEGQFNTLEEVKAWFYRM